MRHALPLLAFALATSAPLAAAEIAPVAPFRSVQLSGGGTVTVRPATVQRVTLVSGSSQFTTMRVDRQGKLEINACNDRCPHNYRLEIVIDSPRLPDVAINGGGRIVAAPGFRPQSQISAAVSGGGSIDLRSVAGESVSAAVNGGGQILVRPRVRLAGAVNGGGTIRFWGNPHVSSVVNGGGRVVPGN
jgi:putative autotransporter adhesin-like protein